MVSFTCTKCAEVFIRKGMFDKHCCEFPCKFCSKTFPRKWNCDTHEKTCKVKLAMGMGDMKAILLEVQQKVRNLERAHGNYVKRTDIEIQQLRIAHNGLSDKVNKQSWMIHALETKSAPVQKKSAAACEMTRALKRLEFKPKEPKLVWERVDTGQPRYEFDKYLIILDDLRMHKALSNQKHSCWKLMVEQLLEDAMGFELEAEGNILRKGDDVFDTWDSVSQWFWTLVTHWQPTFVDKHDAFGLAPWTYCIEEDTSLVWKGLGYDYRYHRDKLVGKAMAHLIKVDREDKGYLADDPKPEAVTNMESAMKLADELVDELVNEACQEEKKMELVL